MSILRSAVVLVSYNEASSGVGAGSVPTGLREDSGAGISGNALDSVWMSLRLMRGLSADLIGNLSDRIGLGVLSLIR